MEDPSISKPSPPQPPANRNKGPQVLSDRIRANTVRLIDDEGNRIVSREEAERLSRETGLDLLVVSLDSDPPVVRLVDFGKFKFEAEKKAREAKKRQHVVDVKEIKMTVRIDRHDYETKVKHAQKFLEDGNKVKLTIRLKGRENQHQNLAFDLAKRFVVDLEIAGQAETPPRSEGRTITVTLAPSKAALAAAAKRAKASAPHAEDLAEADVDASPELPEAEQTEMIETGKESDYAEDENP
ncbi:MAG: translation initiation factor IF-3 [Candidatus Melainabacteria bacterium]|nr:translation initiation factor IF-3 [Candidatus Melainabacteria bacterium]